MQGRTIYGGEWIVWVLLLFDWCLDIVVFTFNTKSLQAKMIALLLMWWNGRVGMKRRNTLTTHYTQVRHFFWDTGTLLFLIPQNAKWQELKAILRPVQNERVRDNSIVSFPCKIIHGRICQKHCLSWIGCRPIYDSICRWDKLFGTGPLEITFFG